MTLWAPIPPGETVGLHGFAGQPSMWGEAVAGARLPGHGPVPHTEETDFFGVVDALAEALGPAPRWVAGYSLGARLGLWLALRHPRRVARAWLVGGHLGLEGDDARAARQEWDDGQARALDGGDLDAFMERWAALPIFASQARLSAAVRDAQARARRDHDPRGLAWAMRTLGLGRMPPAWSALRDLQVPVTLVSGALDTKYIALHARAAACSSLVNAVVVPDAGHNVVLERPEALARALSDAASPAPS